MMKCFKCGKENLDNGKYCSSCGAKLESEFTGKQGNKNEFDIKKKIKNHRIIIILGSVILALALITSGLIYLKQTKEKHFQNMMLEANRYLKELNYEKASDIYLKMLEVSPKNIECRIKLADTYEAMGNPEKAEQEYQYVLNLDESQEKAYWGLINSYIDQEETEKIPETLEELKNNVKNGEKTDEAIMRYDDYQREKTYLDIVKSYMSSRGYISSQQLVHYYGLCYAKLVDFDGDGIDELIIVRTFSDYSPEQIPDTITDYITEVWAWKDGKIEQVHSGEPHKYNGDGRELILLQKDGKWYLEEGNSDADLNLIYYGYTDGKFQTEMTVNTNIKTLSRTINGEEVTDEEWNTLRNQYTITQKYAFQGYINETDAQCAYKETSNTYAELLHAVKAAQETFQNIVCTDTRKTNGDPLVKYGSYSSDNQEDHVYLYAYKDSKERDVLYITYQKNMDYGEMEFQFNEEKRVYEIIQKDNYKVLPSLAIEQNADNIDLYIKMSGNDSDIKAKLYREKQYDSLDDYEEYLAEAKMRNEAGQSVGIPVSSQEEKDLEVQSLTKEQIAQQIIEHYDSKLPEDDGGSYTISINETMETDTEYTMFLRYAMSEEKSREIIENGGTPSANILAGTAVIEKLTGKVMMNSEIWYLEMK